MYDLIDWVLAPLLGVYVAVGLLMVPLVSWAVVRNYQLRRLALGDYRVSFATTGNSGDESAPNPPRDLRLSDLKSIPGAGLLLLPLAVVLSLHVTWTLTMIPGALAPAFAGWWWLRLRARGVRLAHLYAWLAMLAPSVAWSTAMALRLGDYPWLRDDYSAATLTWWTDDDLVGGRLGIGLVALAIVVLAATAVAAARSAAGRGRGRDLGAPALATLATVPLAALIWMSVPLVVLYTAWMMAMLGFWMAIRVAEVDPRPPEARVQSASTRGGSIADGDDHDEFEFSSARSTRVWQLAVPTALTISLLLLTRTLSPGGLAWPLASWSIVGAVGLVAYAAARLTGSRGLALGVACGSQLIAIMASTLITAGLWAIVGEDISDAYLGRFWLVFLSAQAATLIGVVVLGWIVFALTDDLRRFGALLLGWSWPIALMFALNIHGFDPTPRTLTDDWALSQVVSVVIGMTLWVGVMWRWYGVDEGQAESAVGEAGRVAAEPQVAPVEGRSEA